MPDDLIWVCITVMFIAVLVALFVRLVQHGKRKAEALKAQEGAQALDARVPDSIPSPAPVVNGASREPALSTMEQREQAMMEAKRTHVCMYCNAPVAEPYPAYRMVRSVLDPLLRWLGVKQLDRWRVALGSPRFMRAHEDEFLCRDHQERVMGLLEERLAARTAKLSRELDEARRDLYEYAVSGVHGQIVADMRELRDPKAAKKAKQQAQLQTAVASGAVVDLASRKPAAANGG